MGLYAETEIGMSGKYVAYVSCYTQEKKDGIKIFDVDTKNGKFMEKATVEISNSSYITISHSKKYLYSITDYGVESFAIEPDGMLRSISCASINGMRGCYISTDYTDSFLFVAGYHDGKITVLSLNKDGSIGGIKDEIYHKGMGSVAERRFHPHVNCVKITRDNKYLLAADLGMDQVKVYALDFTTGKLKMVDIIHSEQYSAPRHITFSKDGKYVYIIHELKNYVDVYRYTDQGNNNPEFEKIQTIETLNEYHAGDSAASAIKFSVDYNYMVCSNAGDNSVALYKVNKKDGTLDKLLCLPISGSYPKDASLFPGNKFLVSLNHESNTLTFFSVDMEKNCLAMNTKQIAIHRPNCIVFHELI